MGSAGLSRMAPTPGRLLLCLALASAQVIKDGPRGAGTAFKKCGGTFFGGKDRCFEVTLAKLQVQVGAQGTDDDVRVKVCSDDQKTCCTTPVLKKAFSDDWSANDLEQWGKNSFGPCKGKKFSIKKGLDVTIQKAGKGSLAITSFFIEADGVTSPPGGRSPERFECGRFNLQKGANQSRTNFCGTSPYSYERVKKVKVVVGPDGTNDDVRAEFCSDVNSVCCRTKLSSLLTDDWSKNDDEVWSESDLGSCKTVLYKVERGIKFTLLKNGKDDLQVNKLVVETENLRGAAFSYDCKDFKLASKGVPCVEGVTCKQERVCPKKPAGGVTTRKTTRSPARRTTRTTTRRTTTRKPGFLDRIKGSLGVGGKKKTTTTTRRPTTTTRRPTTSTTKKAGFLDRIKGSLGLGKKATTTTTTTTRRGLLSQAGSVVRTTTTTTRPPFRG